MGSVLAAADATAVAVLSRTSIVLADLALGLFGIAVVAAGRRRESGLAPDAGSADGHAAVGATGE
jgi:hypothetical protein